MKDLIQALTILSKYANDTYSPTHCEHDVMMVFAGITLEMVSEEDKNKLEELGFFWDEESESFASFRFGSC